MSKLETQNQASKSSDATENAQQQSAGKNEGINSFLQEMYTKPNTQSLEVNKNSILPKREPDNKRPDAASDQEVKKEIPDLRHPTTKATDGSPKDAKIETKDFQKDKDAVKMPSAPLEIKDSLSKGFVTKATEPSRQGRSW